MDDGNEFTLCQILRSSKLKFVHGTTILPSFYFIFFVFVSSPLIALFLLCSVVDFFKELPQFIVKVGPTLSKYFGLDWEKRLEVLIFSS